MAMKYIVLHLVIIVLAYKVKGSTSDPIPVIVNGNNATDVPEGTTIMINDTTTDVPITTTIHTTTSSTTVTTTSAPPTTTSTTSTAAPSTTNGTTPTTAGTTTDVPLTTAAPSHSGRRFDGPSFIGGIILASGLMGIGFVSWKFYKARTERNYHTL